MHDVAVVPIFVNAGAAVLPAIIAGIGSAFALLIKPGQLIQILRAKPQIVVGCCFVVAVGWGIWHWIESPTVLPSRNTIKIEDTDWTKFALNLIQEEERVKSLGPLSLYSIPSEPSKAGEAIQSEVNGGIYYRGDARRSGYLGGKSPWDLTLLWNYAEDRTIYCSSPIVAGKKVYGASCVIDVATSYGSVFALNSETGKPLWVTSYKDTAGTKDFKGFFSSPALSQDGHSLIIGQGLHLDADSELICLDAATGQVRWLVPTPMHIEGSPAVEGDIAVAGVGAIERGPEHKPTGNPEKEGNPGFVLGVSISDGKILWRCPVNDPESSPAISEGIAYIGSGMNGSAVIAIRIAPDDQLAPHNLPRMVWKTPTPYPATGAVSVYEDLVLVGCGKGDFVVAAAEPEGYVIALDRLTGAERWRVRLPDAVLGAIAVREGKAIVPVRNGEVVALDLKNNGAVIWRTRVNDTSPILAGPAFTGTLVYAVSQDGNLAVIDAADGSVVEKTYLNAKNKPGEQGLSTSAPLITDGRVYVGSETGGLRALVGRKTK